MKFFQRAPSDKIFTTNIYNLNISVFYLDAGGGGENGLEVLMTVPVIIICSGSSS